MSKTGANTLPNIFFYPGWIWSENGKNKMFSTDMLWSGRELGIEATTLGVIFFLLNMELSSFEAALRLTLPAGGRSLCPAASAKPL